MSVWRQKAAFLALSSRQEGVFVSASSHQVALLSRCSFGAGRSLKQRRRLLAWNTDMR